jgi:hypothetical protein
MVGVELVRAAFNPTNGVLRDEHVVVAEREALSHLFAGAMGHAKNPGSHRTVNHSVVEAAQLIGFAELPTGYRRSKGRCTQPLKTRVLFCCRKAVATLDCRHRE